MQPREGWMWLGGESVLPLLLSSRQLLLLFIYLFLSSCFSWSVYPVLRKKIIYILDEMNDAVNFPDESRLLPHSCGSRRATRDAEPCVWAHVQGKAPRKWL